MKRLFAIPLVAVIASCGGVAWDESWVDAQGNPVAEEVLTSYRGSAHCGWESSVFLSIGWPLGTPRMLAWRRRQYVRDPEGLFQERLLSTYDPDVTLPMAARATGYRTNDAKAALWISPTDVDRHIYVVRGETVERWPRTAEVIACA